MGASLLAMAVNQSPDVLADNPLSRAGSLPQLFLAVADAPYLLRQIDPIDKRLTCIRAFCVAL
ncbi:hypothetical protein C1X30_06505 [Pseudomonas sp. FW305-BF6]|nr:hypothetical protein C1X28_11910 [Pseudomonas sp. FW305-BF15]PNB81533.1 hypothetical protein C1X30_06505 [Pseudomonas sp. FW305-BF6]TEA58819.1 hypothetical protein EIY71_25965 [Pseudomonas sp. CH235]